MLIYYIILALTILFGALVMKSASRVVRCLSWVLLFAVWTMPAVLRYGIGTDYLGTYTELIRAAIDGEMATEPGYYALERLMLGVSGDNGYFVFGAASVLTYFFALISFPRKGFLFAALWFVLTLYTFSYNGIRQSVATSFVLCAFACHLTRRRFMGAVFLALACTFHFSVFACLGMIIGAEALVRLRKGVCRRFLVVAVISLSVALFAVQILKVSMPEESRYIQYLVDEQYAEEVSAKLKFLEVVYSFISFALAWCLWDERGRTRSQHLIACLCLMAACVRLASLEWEILRRFSYSTDFALPFALALAYRRKAFGCKLVLSGALICWTVLFAYGLMPGERGVSWHDVVPYRTFFDVARPEWEVNR